MLTQLIEALARHRAAQIEGPSPPFEELPEDVRQQHLKTAALEARELHLALSAADLVVMPREMPLDALESISVRQHVSLEGRNCMLHPDVLQGYYRLNVQAVWPSKQELEQPDVVTVVR